MQLVDVDLQPYFREASEKGISADAVWGQVPGRLGLLISPLAARSAYERAAAAERRKLADRPQATEPEEPPPGVALHGRLERIEDAILTTGAEQVRVLRQCLDALQTIQVASELIHKQVEETLRELREARDAEGQT
jgi:hypothetical protein